MNNNMYFILPNPKDKPIKVIIEDRVEVTNNGKAIEIKEHLSHMETEKLLNDIFGTTNIGVLDCSDMTEKEINEIADKLNSTPLANPISSEDLRKILR